MGSTFKLVADGGQEFDAVELIETTERGATLSLGWVRAAGVPELLQRIRDGESRINHLESEVRSLAAEKSSVALKMTEFQEALLHATYKRRRNVGGHLYPGLGDDHCKTSDCAYACGCWMGPSRSGGREGLDPFGDCPFNPKRDLTVEEPETRIAAPLR